MAPPTQDLAAGMANHMAMAVVRVRVRATAQVRSVCIILQFL